MVTVVFDLYLIDLDYVATAYWNLRFITCFM